VNRTTVVSPCAAVTLCQRAGYRSTLERAQGAPTMRSILVLCRIDHPHVLNAAVRRCYICRPTSSGSVRKNSRRPAGHEIEILAVPGPAIVRYAQYHDGEDHRFPDRLSLSPENPIWCCTVKPLSAVLSLPHSRRSFAAKVRFPKNCPKCQLSHDLVSCGILFERQDSL